MRVPTSEEAMEELPRRKRKRSLSAIDAFSDDSVSEDGQVTSYASSVTLCAQSSATEPSASNEKRFAEIEHQLASQQEMLRRLLSASEAVSPPASTPEETYEPPPAHTPEGCSGASVSRKPEDTYELARLDAGFSDQYEWNAAYIHGMIRIDGKPSKPITKNPPCGPCAEASKFTVCVGLKHDDPFKEFLVDQKKICCGWCEYEKIEVEGNHRPKERFHANARSLSSSESGDTEQKYPESTDVDAPELPKLSSRQSEFFINGEGLDRGVVTTEIPRYLGMDSLVRPGTHSDLATNKRIEGYYIKAHRPPTSAMLADLRADSAAWQLEKEKRKLDATTADVEEVYPGKQPSRYQTYPFEFECRRN